MTTRVNRQWRLKHRPVGEIEAGDLVMSEETVGPIGSGRALVRNVYLSLDPTNRVWMSDMDQYMPPVAVGDVMRGGTIGVVEESDVARLPVGAVVQGLGSWQDYVVTDGALFTAFEPMSGLPLTAYMGVLGFIGATAYFGLLDIADPQPGETVVVSTAAGAVGSLVGQIAKIKAVVPLASPGRPRSARGSPTHLATTRPSTTRRKTCSRVSGVIVQMGSTCTSKTSGARFSMPCSR